MGLQQWLKLPLTYLTHKRHSSYNRWKMNSIVLARHTRVKLQSQNTWMICYSSSTKIYYNVCCNVILKLAFCIRAIVVKISRKTIVGIQKEKKEGLGALLKTHRFAMKCVTFLCAHKVEFISFSYYIKHMLWNSVGHCQRLILTTKKLVLSTFLCGWN